MFIVIKYFLVRFSTFSCRSRLHESLYVNVLEETETRYVSEKHENNEFSESSLFTEVISQAVRLC